MIEVSSPQCELERQEGISQTSIKCIYDYSFIIYESKVVRIHLLQDVVYNLYILDDYLILSIDKQSQQPKYVIPLTYDTTIHWSMDKQIHKIKAFGFNYNNEIKFFYAPSTDLDAIKTFLANKVIFYGITNFFTVYQQLGRGSSSQVHLLRMKSDIRKKQASKCINKFQLIKDGQYDSLFNQMAILTNEIDCMKVLNHPNIIKLIEIFEGEKQYYLIMQLMKGKSLSHKIQDYVRDGFHFKFQEIKEILKNILQGVAYMHSKRIMHRDLKPDNIMYGRCDDTSSLKLVDFGLATRVDCKQLIHPKCGTPGYTAPEVINCGGMKYDVVCDIFSVGAIMFKLITLNDLFPGQSQRDVFELNKRCKINLNILALYKTPKSALNLIRQMLQINPEVRISAEDALQHEFFQECFDTAPEEKMFSIKKKFHVKNQQLIDPYKPLWKTNEFEAKSKGLNDGILKFLSIDLINDEKANIASIPSIDVKRNSYLGSYVLKEIVLGGKQINQKQKMFKKFQTHDFDNSTQSRQIPIQSINPLDQQNQN